MKVFARKQKSLSILPPSTPKKAEFEMSPVAIRNSFHGWLNSVGPTAPNRTAPPPVKRVPRLTIHDIMCVNHATIREGESHCVWPPFALERFQAGEVIRENKTTLYTIDDANLRKISD